MTKCKVSDGAVAGWRGKELSQVHIWKQAETGLACTKTAGMPAMPHTQGYPELTPTAYVYESVHVLRHPKYYRMQAWPRPSHQEIRKLTRSTPMQCHGCHSLSLLCCGHPSSFCKL